MTIKVQVSADFPANPILQNEFTVTATPFTIPPTASVVFFNVATAAIATLPDAATWEVYHSTGSLFLKDISGNSGANNITIRRAGSNTIDGMTSIVINGNYGFYYLKVNNSDWIVA
jgi:hypothetical protein